MHKTIVVDVDMVVVDSGASWLAWLNYKSGKNLTLDDCKHNYDLGVYFPELSNPYLFWTQQDLYDDLVPMEGVVGSLSRLHQAGFNIVFASYCKKGHFGSKYDFLDKWFPFMVGFHATKEKHQIKADYFIDDRNEFLNKRDDECKLIKFPTTYTQSESLKKDVFVGDWPLIEKYILVEYTLEQQKESTQ